MKKTTFALCCHIRPAGILVAIFAVCLCSIALSVYYLHNVTLTTPLDAIGGGIKWRKEAKHIADDNTLNFHNNEVEGNRRSETKLKNAEFLNYIDVQRRIEDDKNAEQAAQVKRKIEYPEKLIPLEHLKVALNKSMETKNNKEMWPIHIKVQKKTHKMFHSSNPLYEKPTRTRQNWNGERYIVYLCHNNLTCAGWGDRQHGVFAVYLLSLMTNRTFKVDFTNPCDLSKLYHPRIKNWKIDPNEFDGLSSTHVYAVNDRDFREVMKVIDFNEYFPQDVVYFTTNYDYYYPLKANPHYKDLFRTQIRNRPRPIIFADLWQNIFKFNKRVIRKYTPALTKAHVSNQHKLVCAHIRFGRNPTIPYDSDVRNTLTSIKPFWEFVKQHSDRNKYRLFVASDWEGFRERVNHFYKNIVIDIEGKVIHIDQMKKKSNSSVSQSDLACDGMEKVIADQHVLSKCDILLLTYSVFGKAAAYLRRSNKDLYLMDKGKIQSLVLFKEGYNKKN